MMLSLVILIVFPLVYGILRHQVQTIKKVANSSVLQIDIRENLLDKLPFVMGKPNGLRFPLEKLAILKELRFKDNIFRCYAEIIIPGLDESGKLHYEYRLCRIVEMNFLPLLRISGIEIADFQKFPESLEHYKKFCNRIPYEKDNFRIFRFAGISFPQWSKELSKWNILDRYVSGISGEKSYNLIDNFCLVSPNLYRSNPKNRLRYNVAKEQLFPLIREHLSLVKEQNKIVLQRIEVARILKLLVSSEVHESQRNIYEVTAFELAELQRKSQELELFYKRVITDILIGVELSTQDFSLMSDDLLFVKAQYETQCKRLKDEHQYIKDASVAYAGLLNQRSI
jgi:hypothetical protein